MHALRAYSTEQLAWPGWLARFVGRVRTTWPWLLGLPVILLLMLFFGVAGLELPTQAQWVYADFIPRWIIQLIYFGLTALVFVAVGVSGVGYWRRLDEPRVRSGSLWPHLAPLFTDMLLHRRFRSPHRDRRYWGHLLLVIGFFAALVSAGLAVDLYALLYDGPISLTHPFKIMVNLSALPLLVGGVLLWRERFARARAVGYATAYDLFFIGMILVTIISGIASEIGRLALPVPVACGIYLFHLAAVFTLIGTSPFSKFSHVIYHTLALAHCRMASPPAR